MATATNYDPVKAGFRVSDKPITRKARQQSTKPQPKPRYADAVWYTFNEHQPLEVTVPTRAVDDTVRLLKRSARYLERNRPVEVRVQISVEPVMVQDTDGEGKPLFDKGEPVMVPAKPAKSVVKFMGHKPWMLGRRIAKTEAEAREAGLEAAEAVMAASELPEPRPAGQHRRRVAGTRPEPQHRKTALPLAMARAVITRPRPLCSRWCGMRGSRCFCVVFPRTQPRVFASCYQRNLPVVSSKPRPSLRGQTMGREGGFMRYYREYIEIVDEPGQPPRVEEIRLCHDFPEIEPTDDNQVIVFDERVELTDACLDGDWPTQTWGVLVT